MGDYTLHCNIENCRTPLIEIAWVTRCMHVFCPGHGQAYFSLISPQIHCPVCNEINLKDIDILKCEVSPTDMIIAGVPPLTAMNLASKSLKLWLYQIHEEQRHCLTRLNYLEKKNSEMKYSFNQILNKMRQKHLTKVNGLKKECAVMKRTIEDLNNELRINKERMQKYKYNASSNKRLDQTEYHDLSPQWFSTVDDLLRSSPSSLNNPGANFTFNESSFFK